MRGRLVDVAGARLEVFEAGAGEPVVFVQTALTADELLPVADHPALAGVRRILYHRRGYAGSSRVIGPGSITRDAADCVLLLDAIGIDTAHVVGTSYSSAVALQVAATLPARVACLTLIEPPPVHTSYREEFVATSERLLETRREHGTHVALDAFFEMMSGPGWEAASERLLPGSVAQMRHDAATFFDTDVPALLGWEFRPVDAARVDSPVLLVGAGGSGPWFGAARRLLRTWLPGASEVVVDDAGHDVAMTHPAPVAQAIAAFRRANA